MTWPVLASVTSRAPGRAVLDPAATTEEVGTCGSGAPGPAPPAPRRPVPWAQLLRRVLSIDALACPRCSTHERRVPMTVLAFLTDPEVVGKILRHLGLPTSAPALAAATRAPQPDLGLELAGEEAEPRDAEGDGGEECGPRAPPSRPPP